MSRKSKSKDQTKALNIPFTLTQGDLLQEALAVTFAKDQTLALNIPVKVPLGGGRYTPNQHFVLPLRKMQGKMMSLPVANFR
jgi:hypothetical protein